MIYYLYIISNQIMDRSGSHAAKFASSETKYISCYSYIAAGLLVFLELLSCIMSSYKRFVKYVELWFVQQKPHSVIAGSYTRLLLPGKTIVLLSLLMLMMNLFNYQVIHVQAVQKKCLTKIQFYSELGGKCLVSLLCEIIN